MCRLILEIGFGERDVGRGHRRVRAWGRWELICIQMLINQKEGTEAGGTHQGGFICKGSKSTAKELKEKGTGPALSLERAWSTLWRHKDLKESGPWELEEKISPPLSLSLISAGLNLLCFPASFLPPAVETSCGEKHSYLLASFTGSRILSPSKCPSVQEKFSLVAWVTWQPIGPITNARVMGYCGSLNLGTLPMTW